MLEQQRQVRVMQPRVLLEQRRVPSVDRVLQFSVRVDVSDQHTQPCLYDKSMHVLRRNGCHQELLPHAQYRQVRVVHWKQVLEQRSMPSVDHVLEFSVPIYVSDYHAQPCLFAKSLHVLRRNARHRKLLPNAQYRQVRVVHRKQVLAQRRMP